LFTEVRYHPHFEMGIEVGTMGRTLNRLSDVSAKAEKRPGRHSDGGGLYLNVSPSGTKSWLFMWVRYGKRREMGLGGYPVVTLAKARSQAAACRTAVSEGRDPIAERLRKAEPTFGECADQYIASIKSEWRNAKHEYQWNQTLTAHCQPIRTMRVSEIATDDVLKVLTPIWQSTNETASRLRGRIERVLDFAKVKGWRTGENPALWRGHLRNILPKRQKLQRGHLRAMPYEDVPAFVERLRKAEAMAARALEFAILTVARSGEVLGATWQEIDFGRKLWTVPKYRMKTGETHKVPLSDAALAVLKPLHEARVSEFVFPGLTSGRPLSGMAMEMLLRRMKVTNATVHGFRSSFRDWCGDTTNFPREVAEAALAHKVGDEVERAYRRSDALEKRSRLMQAWADYCSSVKADNVVRLTR
jgi:integrase